MLARATTDAASSLPRRVYVTRENLGRRVALTSTYGYGAECYNGRSSPQRGKIKKNN